MRLSELEKYRTITIQCHDNPDADAISAGYGLYCYFTEKNCKVRLIYSGRNEIKKSNLKLMIEKLDIPIAYVAATPRQKIEGLLITVDCQYGAGNVTRFEAEQVASIDHHLLESEHLELIRIQPNLGSCATLVWSMLEEEEFPVAKDINLGTALYYGLYMDTNQFSELFNPLDMDMRESVQVNKRLMTQFRNSNISLDELSIAGIAMIRYHYNEDYRFAVIKAEPCDPNILGMISDFLLQVDVIDTCVVYNELNDGYKFSVRSCIREVNANELAIYLADGIGSGGGHYEKAGGFISVKMFEEKYHGLHSEVYFNNRMVDYFDSFQILYAKDMQLNTGKMKQYVRSDGPICYIRMEDIVEPDTPISLRTRKGNLETTVSEGMYFAIERDGVVHSMPEWRFRQRLQSIGEHMTKEYWEDPKYVPTVRDWTENKIYRIVDFAKLCMPKKEFCVYAMQLDSYVKLFPEEDEGRYMLGKPGDYLVESVSEPGHMYIEPGDKFLERFQEI